MSKTKQPAIFFLVILGAGLLLPSAVSAKVTEEPPETPGIPDEKEKHPISQPSETPELGLPESQQEAQQPSKPSESETEIESK